MSRVRIISRFRLALDHCGVHIKRSTYTFSFVTWSDCGTNRKLHNCCTSKGDKGSRDRVSESRSFSAKRRFSESCCETNSIMNFKSCFCLTFLAFVSLVNGLNFFTATVDTSNTQQAPYSQLLSGNDVFETLYSTFNSTGIMLLGASLLLSSGNHFIDWFEVHFYWLFFIFLGLLAIPFLPGPNDIENSIENSLHKIRNGPLGFIPKPGLGKKTAVKNEILTSVKPVVYSFDQEENEELRRSYESKLTQLENKLDLGHVPGP